MREIHTDTITQVVRNLCIEACCELGDDVAELMKQALKKETYPLARNILEQLIKNIELAKKQHIPICQDTGMAVVFLDIGQDIHITGGNIYDAINKGVRQGYTEGYLRKSVVESPICRVNTKDNTPAIIHTSIVPGNRITINVAPKGFGSENKSRLKMLNPSDGVQGIKDFVLETVTLAGGGPCPPGIIGIGIGGTMENAAYMAKKALLRPAGRHNSDENIAKLEKELLSAINSTGIGPQGLGGNTTALAVHIDTFATHIAGLPVAVNMQCHAARHKQSIL
ncbi:fumarate hydratase [Xylanivirga thermophila]|uniref:fumarate hydratase n=1 Tax=Xylanivirga thermophila TaxID=2496273 RepID=UPI00101B99D8|nr:fumarate hydratase [Xylanivirga thermophila]